MPLAASEPAAQVSSHSPALPLANVEAKTAPTVVMLVTSDGLTDPRVLRAMWTARRAGFRVRLLCRPRADESEGDGRRIPAGVDVHRVSRLPGLQGFKRLFAPRSELAVTSGTRRSGLAQRTLPFWIKPWELWILGGITWFTWQALWKVGRCPAVLYHAHDLDTLPAGAVLSRLKGVPLLYDAHELFCDQFSGASRQFRAILFGLEHWLIRFAHAVVTVNHSIAEQLSAWHTVPLPAVVMKCPMAEQTGKTVASQLRLPYRKGARVTYQGIFVQDRGLEQLVLSARWYESAELYLRGFGPLEPVLRALVEAEGLEDRVHVLPPAEPSQLVQSLEGFDIGVVPYRATTLNNRLCLPNKVFEYLQAGLALAVSALPELEQVVKETAAGEVFDPEQPRDIARAINSLTCDVERLIDLQARARAAGRGRYTWEAQGEPRLLACYRALV
ncbi:MAG: glycosyltransferase, partial [Candidatus Methylomirabilis sp.]